MFDSVLDTFTGADENPITTNWTAPIRSSGNAQRLSNTIAPQTSAEGGAYYDLATFGPDCEAWATITTLPGGTSADCHVFVRAGSVGTTSLYGYSVYVYYNGAGNNYITLAKWTANAYVDLAASTYMADAWQVGDKLGIRAISTGITGWRWRVSSGEWTQEASASDSAYSAAGYAGIHMRNQNPAMDDFGAADISGGAAPVLFTIRSSQRW